MSAYMISQVEVTDPAAFQDYMKQTMAVASKFGAELVLRGKTNRILNGEPNQHQLVVAAKFKDMDTINEWYQSPEYQALIPLRDKGSNQTMITYEDMD